MKSHFRRLNDHHQAFLLPWEKNPPQYKIETDRSALKSVSTLSQSAPSEIFKIAELSQEWFLDRVRESDFDDLSPKEKMRLATLWYREALFERKYSEQLGLLSQELLGWGAPPTLLKGCARALLDEVEHCRLSYSVVKALAGGEVSFKEVPTLHSQDPDFETTSLEGVSQASPLKSTPMPHQIKEEFFQCAWKVLQQGVLVQELSARFSIHLSREKLFSPIIAELLKKSIDEHRHSDLYWDVFAWSMRKLGKESVDRLWVMWTHMPKAKFSEALIGDGKCRDYYRDVRLDISERLKRFFEQEWGYTLGENIQTEKALPISRPAS